jgi:hypothetical protein
MIGKCGDSDGDSTGVITGAVTGARGWAQHLVTAGPTSVIIGGTLRESIEGNAHAGSPVVAWTLRPLAPDREALGTGGLNA